MSWIRRASALAAGALMTAALLVFVPAADATAATPTGATAAHRHLPVTEILEGPPKQTPSRKGRFVFAATPTATYTCALDKKAAAPCTSPYKVKNLKLGKHKVTITATDATGTESPPAKYTWKVIKKPAGCTGECRAAAGDGYRG